MIITDGQKFLWGITELQRDMIVSSPSSFQAWEVEYMDIKI